MTRVRVGSEADRAYVRDLGSRTLRDNVADFRDADDARLRESFDDLVRYVFATSHILLVAQGDEGKTCGFLLMLDTMPDEVTRTPQGFIAYMAVEPYARGRGIAGLLLRAAEEQARSRRLPTIGLMVTEDNAAARALYRAAGYKTERRLLCKTL